MRGRVQKAVGILGVAALALASTACGYTELHEALLRPASAPTNRVEIYLGDTLPPRPFYEVALVQVLGYGSDADVEDLNGALQARGRGLGCDGLVRVRFDLGRSIGQGYGVCVRWAEGQHGTVVMTPARVPPPDAPREGASKEHGL